MLNSFLDARCSMIKIVREEPNASIANAEQRAIHTVRRTKKMAACITEQKRVAH